MVKLLLASIAATLVVPAVSSVSAQATFAETFEAAGSTLTGQHGPTGLLSAGWEFRNQSEPLRSGDWIRFAYSYQGKWALHVDRSVSFWIDDKSEISTWCILPDAPGQIAGDEVRFFYSSVPPGILNPQQATAHLEVRYSPSGGTNTGSQPDDIGDFTTLLADLPDPGSQIWSEFSVPVPGSGRVALRFTIPPSPMQSTWWGSFHLDNLSIGPVPQGPPLPAAGETVQWTTAMSPIAITELTTIPVGGTVIVEPGVVVDVGPTAVVTIAGTMIGVGLPGQPVTLQGLDRVNVTGILELEEAFVDLGINALNASTVTLRNVSFLGNSYLFTGGAATYPAFLEIDQCTFEGSLVRVGSCILRLTNSSFSNSFCEIGGCNLFLDGTSFDGATQEGLNLQFFLQPVWVDNITITNSAESGLNLVAVNAKLGPNVTLAGNQFPAQIGGSGFLPGSSLPAFGNGRNHVNVEFASAGLIGGNVWSDVGIPYAIPTYYSAGTLDILEGVHVQLGPQVDFWGVSGPVEARGTPANPVIFDRLDPTQPWHGLQKFHRYENCIIDGGVVGARFNSITFPGFVDNSIIKNCEFGIQNDALVRKTRFLNNEIGAWENNWTDSLNGSVGANSFQGNVLAVQSLNQLIDAPNNWWNSPTGPSSNDNPAGQGEPVFGFVDTLPFLTAAPDFTDNPPMVELNRHDFLLEPNSKVILTWSSQDDSAVVSHRIEFDHPLGFGAITIVASDLPGTAQAYEWTIPNIGFIVNGKLPRVRVVAIDDSGQEGWDASDHVIPSGEVGGVLTITSDLSGPFVSGVPAEQLCWDASGVTGPIGTTGASLQLGADRTSVPLGGSFSSCLPGTGMGIPFVSTDTARVAITVAGTSNRVKYFFSQPFTIRPDTRLGDAPPSITMISPKAGRVYAGSSVVPITWAASDDEALQAFHVQASYDSGHTWHFLAEDLPATATSFSWKLPPTTGMADVRVRVIAVDLRFQNSSDGGDVSFSIEDLPPSTGRREGRRSVR